MLKQQLIQLIEHKFPKASEILRMTTVEQCRYALSKDGKFCAYGAIYNFFGWNGNTWGDGDDDGVTFDYDTLIDQLGLRRYDFEQYKYKESMNITRMNDHYGMSFAEIADVLEKEGL